MMKGCILQEWFLIKHSVLYFWFTELNSDSSCYLLSKWSPEKWAYNADYSHILKICKAFICKNLIFENESLNITSQLFELQIALQLVFRTFWISNNMVQGSFSDISMIWLKKNITKNIIMNKIGSEHLQWKMHSIELLSETFGSAAAYIGPSIIEV